MQSPGRRAPRRSQAPAPRQDRIQAGAAPKAARLQLEADEEEQQHYTELGELQGGLHFTNHAEAPGADQHAGTKVAEHGPELQATEQRHEQHRGEKKYCCLFKEVHGGGPGKKGFAALCAGGATRETSLAIAC